MVKLVEMPPASYDKWKAQIWKAYREEMIRAGTSEAAADENVQENIKELMPDGKLTPGNFVFDVMKAEDHVGYVWLNEKNSEWFIYDIEVFEKYRGRGFGRETMQAIEAHIRAKGGNVIGLSVFGFNKVAQKLYETEGYDVTRLSMQKKLN
jgi:ribosomal protein S18 acetylase RimI-like enzyme